MSRDLMKRGGRRAWHRRSLFGLALACLCSFAATASAQSLSASTPIKIGVAGPLTGSDAVFGSQLRLGVEQAIGDINAGGGILGRRVVVALGDDLGDPKHGTDVAATFVRDKVSLVVGPFSSAVALPASATYGAANILEIIPAATLPRLTEQSVPTLFRICGRDDQQSQVAARFLLDRRETKIAILHDRTMAGKALADALRKALAAGGIKDGLYASLDKGEKDFRPLALRIKASGARVAFWGGTQTEAGLLVRQLHNAGADVTLMGGAGIVSDDFASLAGPGADGTLAAFPPDPRQRPEAADLLRRLKSTKIEPDAYTFYAYAAVQVFQQAAQAAQSIEAKDVAAAIHSGMVFKTVLGALTFDAKGDVAAPDYSIYVWRKGPGGRSSFQDLARF